MPLPWERDWSTEQTAAPPPWERDWSGPSPESLIDKLARQAGLTGRYAAEGALALPEMAGTSIGKLGHYLSGGLLPNPQLGAVSRLLTSIGMPEPKTPTERVVGDISRGLAGAATGVGIGGAVPAAAPLAAQPGMQAASAITGGGAAGIAREQGVGPWGQLGAGLLGAIAPQAATVGGEALIRALARGGEAGRQQLARRLQTFEQAGVTTPSAGLATGNRGLQQAEAGLSQVSASAGVMDREAARIADEMGARVEQLAAGLTPKSSATRAGLTIEKGIGGFVKRFQAEQGQLYDQLDQFIPASSQVPVANLQATLGRMTTPIAGAEATSSRLRPPAIAGIAEAVAQDAQSGMMPYGAIKQLRTTIGEKIANPQLVSDMSTAQWKQLYGALSQDMGAAAQAAGPDALRAFNRANTFTAAGHLRIEDVLNRVAGKDTAERVFQAAVNPSEIRQGGTTIMGVMRSLQPDERNIVTAAVVRRMGLANPGQQNELGEQFSSQTFLTNWNKIAPEAKMVLFPQAGLRQNLDQVAKAADYIKQGAKVFANPSGTAPALSNQLTRWTIAGALITGHPELAATVGGLLIGANLGARLMTKPDFVNWLAAATKVPASSAPAMVNQIVQRSAKWSPEDRAALQQALNEAGLPAK